MVEPRHRKLKNERQFVWTHLSCVLVQWWAVALGVARCLCSEIPLTDVLVRHKRNRDGGLIVTSGSLISVALVAQTVHFQFSSNLRQTPDDIDVRRRER
jgi:hypothetical protein